MRAGALLLVMCACGGGQTVPADGGDADLWSQEDLASAGDLRVRDLAFPPPPDLATFSRDMASACATVGGPCCPNDATHTGRWGWCGGGMTCIFGAPPGCQPCGLISQFCCEEGTACMTGSCKSLGDPNIKGVCN